MLLKNYEKLKKSKINSITKDLIMISLFIGILLKTVSSCNNIIGLDSSTKIDQIKCLVVQYHLLNLKILQASLNPNTKTY